MTKMQTLSWFNDSNMAFLSTLPCCLFQIGTLSKCHGKECIYFWALRNEQGLDRWLLGHEKILESENLQAEETMSGYQQQCSSIAAQDKLLHWIYCNQAPKHYGMGNMPRWTIFFVTMSIIQIFPDNITWKFTWSYIFCNSQVY